MASLKGTKTEQNLLKAFAGESQARNRYTLFAEKAKEEGYEQIAEFFLETAYNEFEHAKLFFSFLEGRPLEITATYPAGKVGTTEENLKAAELGENEEFIEIYPEFAKIAKEEGFPAIAKAFELVLLVEHEHEKRYNALWSNVKKGEVFKKSDERVWTCKKCGHEHKNKESLKACPICKAKQAWFEIKKENY